MIKSMTGYGGAKGTVEGLSISIELKSVNNRYLDVSAKLPRSFLFAEELIKAAVGRHISRGKVDVFVSVDASASDDMVVRVNEPLLRGYIDALGAVSEKYGLENDMTLMSICRLPEVLSTDRRELDNSALAEGIGAILETALTEYDAMRLREGEKLTLTGLGTFSVQQKPERVGRNPRTGAAVKIPPRKAIKFRPTAEID